MPAKCSPNQSLVRSTRIFSAVTQTTKQREHIGSTGTSAAFALRRESNQSMGVEYDTNPYGLSLWGCDPVP